MIEEGYPLAIAVLTGLVMSLAFLILTLRSELRRTSSELLKVISQWETLYESERAESAKYFSKYIELLKGKL